MNSETSVFIDYLDKLDGRGSTVKSSSMLAIRRASTIDEGLRALRMVLTRDWMLPTIRSKDCIVSVHDLQYDEILQAFWKKWRSRRDRSFFDRLRYTEGYTPERVSNGFSRYKVNANFTMIICHDSDQHYRKLLRSTGGYIRDWRVNYQLLDISRNEAFQRFSELAEKQNEIRSEGLNTTLILDVGNFVYNFSAKRILYHFESV